MNIKKFFSEIIIELKQTTFPSQNIVFSFTLFVIVFTILMSIFLALLDLGFGEAVIKFITNFN
jgi:preprotein translocase SecE subunit